VKAVIVPVPSIVLALVVVLTSEPPVVTVVVLDCARVVPTARAQAAPAANIFVNVFCFMFVLWLFERMMSVVFVSDSSQLSFIHPLFVRSRSLGCISR
jgi:hypothetical protein